MSAPGVFVPGLFSQVGRSTAFEIENLQSQCRIELPEAQSGDPGSDEGHGKAAAQSAKSKVHAKGSGASFFQDDVKPQTPAGELAKAIQEKLRTNQAKEAKASKQDANSGKGLAVEKSDQPSAPFNFEGKDGNWASKFTASYDIGSINHRNEQHPDVCWYKVKHDGVLDRPPAWDFRARPKHQPLSIPAEEDLKAEHAFLTSIDINDQDAVQALTARQRQTMKDLQGIKPERPKGYSSAMSLNSERGPLGKIGRIHVNANEVSCAGDSDLLDQDIKGYQKLRYPRWDFEAYEERKPLIKPDSLSEPGKYDYSLDCVKGVPKSGIGFGKALPRSVCVSTMGYSAPPAVLHPEQKRTRGQLPDRSRMKDAVRTRVTHVNDFDRELARPPLLVTQGGEYHDKSDAAACEAVHKRAMSYDAETADIYVTHRRDIAPKYDRMLGRGRDCVQGNRGLSHDLAVRGSVGLGFIETKSMVEHSVEQREARAADGKNDNPNIGVRLDHTTYNVHTTATEKQLRGRHLVRGSGKDVKESPLKRKEHPILANAYKRSPSLPGFDSRSKFGGTRVLAGSRSSSAIPGWAPEELEKLSE